MKELNQVVSKSLANKISMVIDRECNGSVVDVLARKEVYGYFVVTVAASPDDENYVEGSGNLPSVFGAAFAFDRKGKLLDQREWRAEVSEPSATEVAIDSAGAALARDLLVAQPNMFGARIRNGTACIGIDTFELLFKPSQNHLTKESSFEGWMFETYGKDAEYVQSIAQAAPGRVWTILVAEEVEIVSGMRWVNRQGYLVTEYPRTDGLDFFVSLN